jgi:transcriptional regulator with XRE-family HTH domain
MKQEVDSCRSSSQLRNTSKDSSSMRKAIGDLIREQRRCSGHCLSQEELAHRSGISFQHLNKIENYRANVSVEVLHQIAFALGYRRLSDFLARGDPDLL